MNDIQRSALRVLVDSRQGIQKSRIQMGGRINAIERGVDTATPEVLDTLKRTKAHLTSIEDDLNDQIGYMVHDFPIFEYGRNVKGVGDVSLSQIVALFDIHKTPTVSSLWKLAGYGVTDGKGDRLRRGEKASFFVALKGACARMGISLIKCRSPYADYYRGKIDFYLTKGFDEKHAKIAARRCMIKLFLQHLWITYRAVEGLPVSEPYSIGIQKHAHYITPQEYGWSLNGKPHND